MVIYSSASILLFFLAQLSIFSSQFLTAINAQNLNEEKTLEELCAELVVGGHCRTNPDLIKKKCAKPCMDWQKSVRSTHTKNIHEGEPSFFDLSSKNATGSVINFRQFEGYVTIVANVAKLCEEGKTEEIYAEYTKIQQIWPYMVEFVIFTFEHPKIDYDAGADFCEPHKEAFKKQGRAINIMEEAKVNGLDSHPVYKYLKSTFDVDDLDLSTPTVFLVTPDGDQIEVHLGPSAREIRDYIHLHLERDL